LLPSALTPAIDRGVTVVEVTYCNSNSVAERHRLPESVENQLNLTRHTGLESLTKVCDAVTLNCPLHRETEHMVNAMTLANFKRGAYLTNTARQLCDRDAVAAAPKSGQLAGYAGEVWFPQSAPADHPWRFIQQNREHRRYDAGVRLACARST
jgi:lactate dehydrogenase-like 2-hydroxyacid dehydrogenase